mgnify:CR=1 FL=1
MDAISEMVLTIRTNVGPIFNICIYTFMLVSAVYAALEIIHQYGK